MLSKLLKTYYYCLFNPLCPVTNPYPMEANLYLIRGAWCDNLGSMDYQFVCIQSRSQYYGLTFCYNLHTVAVGLSLVHFSVITSLSCESI